MPGFRKSKFSNLSANEVKIFSCNICKNIFKDPMVTPCCHQTYCADCINDWIAEYKTCPNDKKQLNKSDLVIAPSIVTNLVDKLQVFCNNRQNGCKQVMHLEDLKTHSNECKFKLYKVCTVCGNEYENDSCHECSESLLFNNICLRRENSELKAEVTKLEETVISLKLDFETEIQKLNKRIASIETFVDENLVTLMHKSQFIKKECQNFQNLLLKTKTMTESVNDGHNVTTDYVCNDNFKEQTFNFSGRYKMICTDNISEYLEILGVSFVTRKLIKSQNPMIDICVENDLYSIKTITAFKTSEIKFFIGKEFKEQRVDGKVVKTVVNAIENKLIQTQFDEKEVIIIRELIGDCLKVISTVFYEENGYKKNVTIIQIFQKIA